MATGGIPSVPGSNPQPVIISQDDQDQDDKKKKKKGGSKDQKHKVKVFMSPDHSIEPFADFIQSAKKSIDMYIPEMKSWTYGTNKPLVSAMWLKEANPIFQSLANVGVKKIKMRFLTHGPQFPFIPYSCDMWEWFIMQDAKVNFILPTVVTIGGIMIIVDGGEKILITSMSGTPASFIYNRDSTIILETKCDEVAKLFVDTFNNDFKKGIPFLPTKKVIMNTKPVPLIDPASLAVIQSFIFKITSVPQPPTPLLESPLQPYISEIMEADDVEYTIAMAGPELVEFYILQAINNLNFVQIATRSLAYENVARTVSVAFSQNPSTSANISYTLEDKKEADESDKNLLELYNNGMNYRIFRGPLYDEKPPTKMYFTHNGQTYLNTGEDILYFMTGSLLKDDLNKHRNFYVGFKSKKLSKQITSLFSGDQLFAKKWNPTAKTAVGKETEHKFGVV